VVAEVASRKMTQRDERWQALGHAIGPGVERPELVRLLDKVRTCAWRITRDDVAGLGADELYEAVLPVAFETADEKRRRAHEAIDAR
jgi:hypothetical protein